MKCKENNGFIKSCKELKTTTERLLNLLPHNDVVAAVLVNFMMLSMADGQKKDEFMKQISEAYDLVRSDIGKEFLSRMEEEDQ